MYLGDIVASQTIDFTFSTCDSSGTPTTLSGSPAISVYKSNSTTESTAGVTLTANFDSVTGLNHVHIVTTDSFYVTGNDFHVVITTGTVATTSVVGYRVAEFSIENRSVADGAFLESSVSDGSPTTSSFIIASGASASDSFYNGSVLAFKSGTLKGIARKITGYTGATRTAQFSTAFPSAPANGDTFIILGRID